jgi:hypothetical protein
LCCRHAGHDPADCACGTEPAPELTPPEPESVESVLVEVFDVLADVCCATVSAWASTATAPDPTTPAAASTAVIMPARRNPRSLAVPGVCWFMSTSL